MNSTPAPWLAPLLLAAGFGMMATAAIMLFNQSSVTIAPTPVVKPKKPDATLILQSQALNDETRLLLKRLLVEMQLPETVYSLISDTLDNTKNDGSSANAPLGLYVYQNQLWLRRQGLNQHMQTLLLTDQNGALKDPEALEPELSFPALKPLTAHVILQGELPDKLWPALLPLSTIDDCSLWASLRSHLSGDAHFSVSLSPDPHMELSWASPELISSPLLTPLHAKPDEGFLMQALPNPSRPECGIGPMLVRWFKPEQGRPEMLIKTGMLKGNTAEGLILPGAKLKPLPGTPGVYVSGKAAQNWLETGHEESEATQLFYSHIDPAILASWHLPELVINANSPAVTVSVDYHAQRLWMDIDWPNTIAPY